MRRSASPLPAALLEGLSVAVIWGGTHTRPLSSHTPAYDRRHGVGKPSVLGVFLFRDAGLDKKELRDIKKRERKLDTVT